MEAAAPAQAEVESESESTKAARMDQIQRFAEIVHEKRKDAIDGRRASGIEQIWDEDEDHYEGRDAYNRNGGLTKGRTTTDQVRVTTKKPAGRSTAFANITRPYCDAAAARVSDMLLPTDDRNWAFKNTPDPVLVNQVNDQTQATGPDGMPMTRQAQPAQGKPPSMMSRIGSSVSGMFGGQPPPGPVPVTQPVTVADIAQQAIDKAKKYAERAQTVVDDWLVECRYHGEVRKVIESSARIGVGILKGPHPAKKKARAISQTPDGWKLSMEIKVAPTSISVNPWNFYPDRNCGDDIQKGSYCLERDDLTGKGLRELKGGGYIDEMIDLCLEEGPISSFDDTRKLQEGQKTTDKDLFEIWYFHGQVSKKDMAAAGCRCDLEVAPCVVTMVNNHIIKITMSVLDSGEFPYDVMVWQDKIGHWAGIGVARQMRTCQKGLNGGVRAMQDNMALSSGPQIIVDSSKIEPADGKWTITPNKLWRKKLDGEDIDDVGKAFTIISIETRQSELLNIINYWTKAAEDVTGLPMLLQGQQGGAPPTLGATQIVNNNGSTVLRRIARTFDDRITEPHIGRYYEWLLLHGPEDAKGEFQIDARGSSALVERDLQNQAMMQMLAASLNPAYQLDPEKVMRETLKGMRIDPKGVSLDDEQKAEMAKRQPPEDPRVTAAKIMAQGRVQTEQLESKQAIDHAAASARLEMQRQQFEASERDKDRALDQMMAELDARIATAKIGSEKEIALQREKVLLASWTLRLRQQKDMALADHTVSLHQSNQVNAAPSEPYGQAQPGKAYTQ